MAGKLLEITERSPGQQLSRPPSAVPTIGLELRCFASRRDRCLCYGLVFEEEEWSLANTGILPDHGGRVTRPPPSVFSSSGAVSICMTNQIYKQYDVTDLASPYGYFKWGAENGLELLKFEANTPMFSMHYVEVRTPC